MDYGSIIGDIPFTVDSGTTEACASVAEDGY